ncbi:hypothetical protein PUN28_019085 [Cardiocondyla obscurior]|uniref:Uncharacterized protein n=1 Tax=Cardiocondyla obscurior TaxID=286306 RepID=A0AAW2EIQ5_9HYME
MKRESSSEDKAEVIEKNKKEKKKETRTKRTPDPSHGSPATGELYLACAADFVSVPLQLAGETFRERKLGSVSSERDRVDRRSLARKYRTISRCHSRRILNKRLDSLRVCLIK